MALEPNPSLIGSIPHAVLRFTSGGYARNPTLDNSQQGERLALAGNTRR